MEKNILELLEETAAKVPNKVCFGETKKEVTYKEYVENCKKIGTGIISKNIKMNNPIAIFIDKTINCLESMMGVVYSGNFYAIVDTNSPKERLNNILKTLKPKAIITDNKNITKIRKFEDIIDKNTKLLLYEELLNKEIDEAKLKLIREEQVDTDLVYVLFTSGSTGIPKGAVLNHRAIIAYTSWVKKTFNINTETVWGSQTPFYFSMSVTDVFTTIISGASLYIIPKMYFSFPIKLLEYMKEKNINTLYWVPSALCVVANLGGLDALKESNLPELNKILFAGEVMPVKQLNMWIKTFSKSLFANLYGPTETTDICSYYIVDRKFKDDETLPIGKHCSNCGVIVLNEKGQLAKTEEEGELLVRGTFLASGYYANKEKTKLAFIQNPLNDKYPEIVYKTGDIVKYNKNGELIYLSRKDYQIKHMGYRIELGEIEKNIYSIENIISCACIYDNVEQKIVLYYQGKIEEKELTKQATEKLLPYMVPSLYINIEKMPHNSNGKIDRKKLKELYDKKS